MQSRWKGIFGPHNRNFTKAHFPQKCYAPWRNPFEHATKPISFTNWETVHLERTQNYKMPSQGTMQFKSGTEFKSYFKWYPHVCYFESWLVLDVCLPSSQVADTYCSTFKLSSKLFWVRFGANHTSHGDMIWSIKFIHKQICKRQRYQWQQNVRCWVW